MTVTNPTNKVIIIGAGPGGLVLAHCLRRHGIPYEIFERERAGQPRRQGWAVGLQECLPDLKELLPEDVYKRLPEASVNHNMEAPDSFALIDCKTGKKTAQVGGVDYNHPHCFLRVNRMALRHVLRQGIDVQNDKELDYYEEFPGSVVAHFKDGTSVTGSLLVGADGAHSAVRKQLYGETKLEQSSFIPIAAELHLTRDQFEPLHEVGTGGLFCYGPNLRYLIGLLNVSEDRSSALYYWACCIRSDTPEKEWEWIRQATSQQLYDRCLEETKYLPSYLTDIMRASTPENMCMPPVRFVEYYLPDVPSGASRVTVLGDAAHVMIPFYLAGANTAIKDACDLARNISKNAQNLHLAIQRYEKRMIPRGRQMVLRSRKAGEAPTLNEIVVRASDEGSGILW